MEKKIVDPKITEKELKRMATNIVDSATTDFIDYVDGMPGKQPGRKEKWDLMDTFWDAIIKEIQSRKLKPTEGE